MDINSNLALWITVPVQFLAIVTINFFWLDYKVSKRDLITILLVIFLPAALLFIFFDSLAAFYLLLGIIIFLFKKYPNKTFILHVLVSFIFAVVADHLASIISMYTMTSISSEFLFIILRNIIFCSILAAGAYTYKKVLIYTVEKYIYNKIPLLLITFLIFLTLVFFYVNISTMPSKSTYESIRANLWIFNIYLLLTIPIVASLIFISFRQYKFRQKEKEHENFLNYVQLLEEGTKNTQKFKHDYINILSSLRHYIDDRDMDGLTTYFYDSILSAHEREIYNVGSFGPLHNLKVPGLKGLLTTKMIHAQEQGIQVHLEITEEIHFMQMDIIELNRILGILLDNAIEGSLDVESPSIRIAFIALEDSNIITIQNKINDMHDLKVHKIYREGYSTKGHNRGLGLSILKKIVNANTSILLHTKIEPTYFIQELEIKN